MTLRALSLSLLSLAACSEAARVELEPSALRFGVRGQTAKIHAMPVAKNGQRVPDQRCQWSSSDDKVATVAGPGNDATVTAAGPGSAKVRCTIGSVVAELPVLVRVVAKVTAAPERVELKLTDELTAVPLTVAAFDDAGAPVQGRPAFSRCASEDVCRGDGRAQLWPVAAGDTTAVVEVEGARSAEIAVHVVDLRSAAAKPQKVKGNPMEAIEREVRKREAAERKKAGN